MPIYEYECPRHGVFEEMRDIGDHRQRCPIQFDGRTCRKKVTKVYSAPGLKFKGSGWYITDYGKRSGTQEETEGEQK